MELPLLTQFYLKYNHFAPQFKNTLFVGVQHGLLTTGSLFESLTRDFNIPPNNIYLLDKVYSHSPIVKNKLIQLGFNYHQHQLPPQHGMYKETNRLDIKSLWEKIFIHLECNQEIEQLSIIDDGGELLKHMPSATQKLLTQRKISVMGIEQTSAGMRQSVLESCPYPIINVAESAGKKKYEATLIINALFNAIMKQDFLQNPGLRCGVIGRGTIGDAMVKKLFTIHKHVEVFDPDQEKMKYNGVINCTSLETLLHSCDVIFACTYHDLFSTIDINKFLATTLGHKYWVNCSSGDYPFHQLLRLKNSFIASYQDVFNTVTLRDKDYLFHIIHGGFPINFDHSGRSVAHEDIALTRAYLLAAILQGSMLMKRKTSIKEKNIMLDPVLQQQITSLWLKERSKIAEPDDIPSLLFYKKYSGGHYIPIPSLYSPQVFPVISL